ncbi:MAG: sodium:calcium antiporter [Spirochaetia bacterium]
MEHLLATFFQNSPLWIIFVSILASFFVLAKSADILVEKTVALSLNWGIPSIIVSATIVSLGTTLPEVSVSVVAAINGDPGLALGNAVGSVITDSSLILGVILILCPFVASRQLLKSQGAMQLGSIALLIFASFLFLGGKNPFQQGGYLPQWFGFLLIGLLAVYIFYSITSSRKAKASFDLSNPTPSVSMLVFIQLALSITFVILASKMLIPALTEVATRWRIPEGVIGATIVALGTSLPELMTAITSAKKGHSEVGVGNILGADILNILSVSGISLAVTPAGFIIGPEFYRIFFPSMLLVVLLFQATAYMAKEKPLGRKLGVSLLGFYVVTSVVGYIFI